MRAGPLASILAAMAATSGCMVAIPPTRLELGAGASAGAARGAEVPTSNVGTVRASLAPLQLVTSLRERTFDFGVGYMLDRDLRGQTEPAGVSLQGAFLEAGGLAVLDRSGERVVSLGARGQGRVLVDQAGRVGPGMALQLSTEIVGFADGTFSGSGSRGFIAGAAYGEGSIGLYAEGAYGSIDGRGLYTMTGGLVWRLPATLAFGVGF